jgi:hypothetical protein
VRRIIALIVVITLIFLITGCGQATYAEVEKRGWFYEEMPDEEFVTLALDIQVKNLTDDTLYIEGSAVSSGSGDKRLLFSLVSDQGEEYMPNSYDMEGVQLLPAEIGPKEKAKGYVVFTELPSDWSAVTLTVEQSSGGDEDGEVIYTEEITKESLSG